MNDSSQTFTKREMEQREINIRQEERMSAVTDQAKLLFSRTDKILSELAKTNQLLAKEFVTKPQLDRALEGIVDDMVEKENQILRLAKTTIAVGGSLLAVVASLVIYVWVQQTGITKSNTAGIIELQRMAENYKTHMEYDVKRQEITNKELRHIRQLLQNPLKAP